MAVRTFATHARNTNICDTLSAWSLYEVTTRTRPYCWGPIFTATSGDGSLLAVNILKEFKIFKVFKNIHCQQGPVARSSGKNGAPAPWAGPCCNLAQGPVARSSGKNGATAPWAGPCCNRAQVPDAEAVANSTMYAVLVRMPSSVNVYYCLSGHIGHFLNA